MKIGVTSVKNSVLGSRGAEVHFQKFCRPLACDNFVKAQPLSRKWDMERLFHKALSLREINGLPSAYDDVLMLSINNFKTNFSRENISNNFRAELKKLLAVKQYMKKTERQVLECINNSSRAQNASNIKEALLVLFPTHVKLLNMQQFSVLREMSYASQALPKEDKSMLNSLITKAYLLIQQSNEKTFFKRKTFLKSLEDLLPFARDKQTFQKIIASANKLPTSEANVSAFIVKYIRRSPAEIEQRLIRRSISSFDHGLAQNLGGKSVAQNVFIVSINSNILKANREFLPWFKQNKNAIATNAQKQIDYLIEKSNNHSIKNIAWYIITLKNSFEKMTNGELNLDISKLKPDKNEQKIINYILEFYPEVFGLKNSKISALREKIIN